MPEAPTVVLFRLDLRLSDNPALRAATDREGGVVPFYVFDEKSEGYWPLGGASRWWLHHSLTSLNESLVAQGSRLIVRRGETLREIREVIRETGAVAVYWNRRYEPSWIKQDNAMEQALSKTGIELREFNASLLFDPDLILNKEGKPFRVFSPFWRNCLSHAKNLTSLPAPKKLARPADWPTSLSVGDLELLPKIPWDVGLVERWKAGEKIAQKRLAKFTRAAGSYAKARDFPAEEATSQLSAHLHFGEIGPRQVWKAIERLSRTSGVFPVDSGAQKFLSEVGWREFAYHLLYHFPNTPREAMNPKFRKFPWFADRGGVKLRDWQRGKTGYPLIDAGMRELWKTGWLPNRVRMVAASFLVKHLRINWTYGAAWFWDTLVDADLANNTLGWQWIAGSGADASPYFRIFAPVTQSEKFDPRGSYIRRWVPELAKLPTRFIHAPWQASEEVLREAGVELGKTYPRPIVDHETARREALAAYATLNGKR